ncbi:hypothetical protein LY90DRAFT_518480 [Neocallimastix californiae]|uniref:Uncharacterized protein n=1 Tax=Neocallimastix californiae TaxID=1754190 RepID=A0A1Y1ZMU7_9FUNG|nr:hypothetical protein LY90DRAFT_518480 [Neocallimastix californiae]|eukprot:ORY11570.1 hypothetical protein LY90DRAFT_518480 [Neocallimastix californiae]
MGQYHCEIYKLILELRYNEAINIKLKNKSFQDIFKSLYNFIKNRNNGVKSASYCRVQNLLYSSNLYVELNNKYSGFYRISYSDIEKLKDYSNDVKNYISVIGPFDVVAVAMYKCEKADFSSPKRIDEYSKNNYQYLLINCHYCSKGKLNNIPSFDDRYYKTL